MKQHRSSTSAVGEAPTTPTKPAAKARARSRHETRTTEHGGQRRPNPAERERMVAREAYFRAERRGFTAGGEVEDWLEAEKEVARRLDETVSPSGS